MACLGALKFTNLDAHQKHLLYLTAAYLGQGCRDEQGGGVLWGKAPKHTPIFYLSAFIMGISSRLESTGLC